MKLVKFFELTMIQLAIDNVPSDTQRCGALKSATGEEGRCYDVSAETKNLMSIIRFEPIFARIEAVVIITIPLRIL